MIRNCLTFQRANEYDEDVNNVCAEFGYPCTEARTTRFYGYLNLRRQMFLMSNGLPIPFPKYRALCGMSSHRLSSSVYRTRKEHHLDD
jgi:hypothetical protein